MNQRLETSARFQSAVGNKAERMRAFIRKLGIGRFLLRYVFTPAVVISDLKLPNQDVTVKVGEHRLKVFSPRKNLIGRALYESGVWEPAVTNFIERETKQGMVALDVGADIGYYTLQFSGLVGPRGRVVAFEPIPKARERLLENIALNQCENITVSEFALGNQEGTVFLEDPFIKSRVNLNKTSGDLNDIKVLIKRFDTLVDELLLPSVDIIKMDIEGAEHEALRGMERSLRRFKPILVIEVHNHFLPSFNSSTRALMDWLASLDYEVTRVDSEILESAPTSTICCRPVTKIGFAS